MREVVWDVTGPLAWITLNRPDALNAENLAWVEGLEQATAEIAARRESRVVLVRGAGRAFCAGLGGGLQLAIACDIRICASDCKLGLPALPRGPARGRGGRRLAARRPPIVRSRPRAHWPLRPCHVARLAGTSTRIRCRRGR
jgi:enoyl-CoA hydratase/carnithine racemase